MTSAVQNILERIPGVDPRVMQRMEAFSGLNEGPAATAARIAGLVQEKSAKDDSAYYTGERHSIPTRPNNLINGVFLAFGMSREFWATSS
jgi:hypothetical protein